MALPVGNLGTQSLPKEGSMQVYAFSLYGEQNPKPEKV